MERSVRERWESLRDRLDAEAQASKMSQEAVLRLSHAYTLLQPNERRVVDEVLSEWLSSEDENKRFDALALIREHHIVSALGALDKLAQRLSRSNEPGAPYELAKVKRVVQQLTAPVSS
jgi:hypothetical protein